MSFFSNLVSKVKSFFTKPAPATVAPTVEASAVQVITPPVTTQPMPKPEVAPVTVAPSIVDLGSAGSPDSTQPQGHDQVKTQEEKNAIAQERRAGQPERHGVNADARREASNPATYAPKVAEYRALTDDNAKAQWLYLHPYMEAAMRIKGDLSAEEVNHLLGQNGDPFAK